MSDFVFREALCFPQRSPVWKAGSSRGPQGILISGVKSLPWTGMETQGSPVFPGNWGIIWSLCVSPGRTAVLHMPVKPEGRKRESLREQGD